MQARRKPRPKSTPLLQISRWSLPGRAPDAKLLAPIFYSVSCYAGFVSNLPIKKPARNLGGQPLLIGVGISGSMRKVTIRKLEPQGPIGNGKRINAYLFGNLLVEVFCRKFRAKPPSIGKVCPRASVQIIATNRAQGTSNKIMNREPSCYD